jgi:hypothetical protein
VQQHAWAKHSVERNRLTVATKSESESSSVDGDPAVLQTQTQTQTQTQVGEIVVVAEGWGGRPWRFSTDLPRAALTTMLSGVGYLL